VRNVLNRTGGDAAPPRPPRLRGAGLAGALVVFTLAGCGGHAEHKPAESRRPVPAAGGFRPGQVSFGVLAPLTGAEAARGEDLVDGAKLAMADLNVRGGVLGQKVAIVTYDDKCEAREGRAGAAAMKGGEVAGAVGGICASAARSAARELGPVKPFLVTSANAPSIVSAKTRNAYLINGTPYQSALATVHWLAYSRAQKLSVVTADDRASRYLGSQVLGLSSPVPKPVAQQAVKAIDGTVVKAALTGDPDAVYWAGPPADGGRLLAALTDAGYHGAFIASQASESPEFLAAAGDAAEGAFVIAPATPQNLPEAAEWAQRFEQKFGHEPGLDALQAYNGVRALAQAVTQSGKVDRRRNGQELEILDDSYKTFLDAGLSFASDHTIKYDNNIVLKVSGGKFAVENTLRSDS
jgi:branched-chain amino acid transport system substrate-binding protein